MPDVQLFLLASALLTLAPGPDNLQVLARGVAQGRRAALVATCGFASGVMFHTLLAVAGVALLIRSTPTLFTLLTYAGAAYLVWLGVAAWRGRALEFVAEDAAVLPLWRVYRQSLLGNALNPKVSLFFVAFLPQFLRPEAGNAGSQMVLLGFLFMAQTLLIFGFIGWFAAGMGVWLRHRAASGLWLNRMAGLVFVLIGLRMAFLDRG